MIVVSGVEVGNAAFVGGVVVSGVEESVAVLEQRTEASLLVASGDDLSRDSRISRAVLDQPHVGLVRVDGLPTQRAAAVRYVAALPVDAYGLAQEVCDAVLSSARTHLALSSVAGLVGARPTLGQHFRSLLPGGSFAVDLHAGSVTSMKPIVWHPPEDALLCVAESASHARLPVELRGRPPGLALTPSPRKRFGVKEWMEVTVIENPAQLLSRILGALRSVRCRSCGRIVAESFCLFCGAFPRQPVPSSYSKRSYQ